MFWGALALLLSGGEPWSIALFGLAWVVRAAAMMGIDGTLGLALAVPVWLLPLRDAMSVAIVFASYCGTEVAWRGHVLHISSPGLAPGKG